jgi:LytS/YehU family sensor histidine kinase
MESNKKYNSNVLDFLLGFATSFFPVCGIAYLVAKLRAKSIRKKEANKRLIAELELKAIRSQMNPHFIFNALSSIQHLINQGNNNEANQYLLNFSKLLRMVLATSEKKLVSLSDEIAQIELYLQLEQLRMPFEYRIEIDQSIQPENEEIPGMLIQPIVENAVKHGVNGQPGRTITLHFSKEAHILLAEITDNGAGFDSSSLIDVDEGLKSSLSLEGFGLKATEERLRLINEDFKSKIGIRTEQNHPTGAKVIISIPV